MVGVVQSIAATCGVRLVRLESKRYEIRQTQSTMGNDSPSWCMWNRRIPHRIFSPSGRIILATRLWRPRGFLFQLWMNGLTRCTVLAAIEPSFVRTSRLQSLLILEYSQVALLLCEVCEVCEAVLVVSKIYVLP